MLQRDTLAKCSNSHDTRLPGWLGACGGVSNKSNHHNSFASKNNSIGEMKYFYFIVFSLNNGQSLNSGMYYQEKLLAQSLALSCIHSCTWLLTSYCLPVTFTMLLTNRPGDPAARALRRLHPTWS